MGCKTPISFDLRKYVEKNSTAHSQCIIKHENKTSCYTNYIVTDLIDTFGDHWKTIRTQTEIRNVYICEKDCVD